jgi:hypothetical protein
MCKGVFMGGTSRWSADAWTDYTKSTATKSRDAIFTSKHSMVDSLNPHGVKVRESRDSAINPESNAIIVGIDVTGSMGMIAEALAREGLGVLFKEILDRKPVPDPHIMFMAIGDASCDSAPLQASQFECDSTIITQLTDIFLEGHGGGNDWESYNLPWYFAANHTSIDCFEKRGKKGFLFTVGDEFPAHDLTRSQIEKVIGDKLQTENLSNEDLLTMVSRSYHVFHVIVEQGSCAQRNLVGVTEAWRKVLGQNVLNLSDYTKLSEVIVSAIQVVEGEKKADVIKSWKGDTSMVVSKALGGLTTKSKTKSGVVRL